jgi:hypothetical protein
MKRFKLVQYYTSEENFSEKLKKNAEKFFKRFGFITLFVYFLH